MKITKFYLLILVSAISFMSLTAYINFNKTAAKIFDSHKTLKITDNKDLIKFNHKLHVKDNGMQCKDCHLKAPSSVTLSDNLIPLMKDCESCHDVKDDKACNLCHYEKVYKPLQPTTKELLFSHKYHIDLGRKCNDCHFGLDSVKLSGESAGLFPKMETCYSCHESKNATNNCSACHTNLTNLKPKSHLNSNFLNEHKVVSNLDDNKNNCMMCHSDDFCQLCHQPNKYTGQNTIKDFYSPYYSKETATKIDRSTLQKLNTVHNLNYLYTHGLDANQKSFECKTCHDPVDFCASCHQNGGNLVTGIAPKSHLQPQFTTVGVNSGGGLHASLAKRDIESCESCHSIEGGDPTCVKCHYDNNGVKGTHPRTHENGFMSSERGIWHNTKGAVCFTCHTDPNARPDGKAGIGFCGYCHGTK